MESPALTPPAGPASSSVSRPASSNNVRHINPVSMIVFEPGVMSQFSRDTESYLEAKLLQLQPLPV